MADAFHAFHSRHVDVHEHHIGRIARDFLDGGFGVGIIAGQFKLRRAADERRQAGADAFIIIHDGNFDLHWLAGLAFESFRRLTIRFEPH